MKYARTKTTTPEARQDGERSWEIWLFGAGFVALFFLFARAHSNPEPARATPIAALEQTSR